ncbi:transposase domain-containing protein, partial [Enterococcus diestrammenae]
MTELEKELTKQLARTTTQLEIMTEQLNNQAKQIENLMNIIANMNRRQFGTKSEQNQNQLSLLDDEENFPFNKAEQTASKAAETET